MRGVATVPSGYRLPPSRPGTRYGATRAQNGAVRRWLRPLGILGALGVAAFLLVIGGQSRTEERVPVRRVGLVRVFPEPGTVAVRQGSVGAELSFGYEGRLSIDATVIPDDQLDIIPGINRLSFTPGEGKEIAALAEGRHCASVTFWTTDAGPDSAGTPFTWCFTAA